MHVRPITRNVRASRLAVATGVQRRGGGSTAAGIGFGVGSGGGDSRGGFRLSGMMGPVVLLAMIALYSAMRSTLQIRTANAGIGAGSFDAPSPGHSPLVGLPLRIPANATLLPPLPEASGVPPPLPEASGVPPRSSLLGQSRLGLASPSTAASPLAPHIPRNPLPPEACSRRYTVDPLKKPPPIQVTPYRSLDHITPDWPRTSFNERSLCARARPKYPSKPCP